ncbi:nucleic-acid-binding protein from transposon X-element [Nephila pilipes]|uniref:Nucleic-acid-binding protein from transposon X-element n=1 Tax=Nephila pilipes TaxID=299642 RepID=A0A8X6Q744_NEPPI|nr:nucleic-acid-binding protein from transposon X-element [Nephila pilipes]
MNTPELLKELIEKIGTKLLGRFVNGKLKVFPETPNQHRIIQNYISVEKMKSQTFEMTHQKMFKVVVRGFPADYDTNEIINELKYFGFNPDHVSVLKNKKSNSNMPIFLVVLKKLEETQDIFNIGYFIVKIEALKKNTMPAQCSRCNNSTTTAGSATAPLSSSNVLAAT